MAELFGPAQGSPSGSGEPRVQAVDSEGQLTLVVDGVVQSVAVRGPQIGRGYWPAMLPERKPTNALILGLGGGTVAHLLVQRFGQLPIVGVDDDPEVLALARQTFGLGAVEGLRVVVDDAFDFVAQCEEQFDYVCVDLFRAGEIPRQATSKTFLRQVRRLLPATGTAAFNLARDRRASERIHRLRQIFFLDRQIFTGLNVVAHCRPPLRPSRVLFD
ncbi:MAG: spermidine synthase [Chloroflexota bacterium]